MLAMHKKSKSFSCSIRGRVRVLCGANSSCRHQRLVLSNEKRWRAENLSLNAARCGAVHVKLA